MATIKHADFGGDWTEAKLERLAKYLPAYTHIMKGQPYKYAYIDAFAGPGYRQRQPKQATLTESLWEDDRLERRRAAAGSAVLAMRSEPPFQKYIFIERDPVALAKLEDRVLREFPHRISRVKFKLGDANAVLKQLCARDWSKHRAVLFLDPYGMEVQWSTIEAVAATKAIDVWILFPAGIGVNRQLPGDGKVPAWARERFDQLFGTTAWYDRFYEESAHNDMFGGPGRVQKVASAEGIANYYLERLRAVFKHVAPNPLVLCNSNRAPMFALCFAAAHPLAAKIARDVLKG